MIHEGADRLLETLALDDHIDHAVFEKKFGPLELIRQLLLDGLFDHARSGKPDQRLRLGNDDISQHRHAGGDAAERGIGEDRDERQFGLAQLRNRGRGLGHLHQREDAFLHARAPGRSDQDDRQLQFQRPVDRAAELFPDHRPHTPAHKAEIEDTEHHTAPVDQAFADDKGIFPARLFLVGLHAISIGLGVLEGQGILGFEFSIPFFEGTEIDEQSDPLSDRDREVILALRADLVIPVDLLAVDDFPAVIALEPHPLAAFRTGRRDRFCRLLFLEPRHGCRLNAVVPYRRVALAKSVENSTGLPPMHLPTYRI